MASWFLRIVIAIFWSIGAYAQSLPLQTCLLYTDDAKFNQHRKQDFEEMHLSASPETNFGAFCSVNVIDGGLLGAAHCFGDTPGGNFFVRCPGKDAIGIDQKTISKLREKATPYDHKGDLAVIKTKKLLAIKTPFKLPSSAESIKELLSLNDCYVAGYPESGFGILRQMKIDTKVLVPNFLSADDVVKMMGDVLLSLRDQKIKRLIRQPKENQVLAQEDLLRNAVKGLGRSIESADEIFAIGSNDSESGDSGGSFYCVKNGESYLLGVLTNGSNEKNGGWLNMQNALFYRNWILSKTSVISGEDIELDIVPSGSQTAQ